MKSLTDIYLEKSQRTGRYADTAENRRLHRVGMPYKRQWAGNTLSKDEDVTKLRSLYEDDEEIQNMRRIQKENEQKMINEISKVNSEYSAEYRRLDVLMSNGELSYEAGKVEQNELSESAEVKMDKIRKHYNSIIKQLDEEIVAHKKGIAQWNKAKEGLLRNVKMLSNKRGKTQQEKAKLTKYRDMLADMISTSSEKSTSVILEKEYGTAFEDIDDRPTTENEPVLQGVNLDDIPNNKKVNMDKYLSDKRRATVDDAWESSIQYLGEPSLMRMNETLTEQFNINFDSMSKAQRAEELYRIIKVRETIENRRQNADNIFKDMYRRRLQTQKDFLKDYPKTITPDKHFTVNEWKEMVLQMNNRNSRIGTEVAERLIDLMSYKNPKMINDISERAVEIALRFAQRKQGFLTDKQAYVLAQHLKKNEQN